MPPARNLDAWDAKAGTERRTVAVIGESNAMPHGVDEADGWVGLLSAGLAAHYGDAGAGYRSLVRAEWAAVGTVTRHTTTDVYDKGPFRVGRRFSGSANGYTWTNPGFTVAADSRLLYVDAAGSGQWSINRDGAGWVNAGAATVGDNGLKAVTIGGPVTSTLQVRGANAAGTSAQCDLIGLDVRTGITGGVLSHNVAVSAHKLSGPVQGAGLIEAFVHSTAGDDLAILDVLDPDVLIVHFVSDAILDDVPTYRAALQEVIDRVHGNGGQVLVNYYPAIDPVAIPNQEELREAMLAEVLENDLAMADCFHPFAGGDWIAARDAGLFQGGVGGDNVHFSEAGHAILADVLLRKLGRTSGGFVGIV